MRFLFAGLSSTLCFTFLEATPPVLALRLKKFHLTQQEIANFFTIFPAVFVISSYFSAQIMHKLNKMKTLKNSLLFATISLFLQGPSQILQMPNSLAIMILAQILIGIVSPFLLVPNLPEMIAAIEEEGKYT